jgi:hypothetical protein
MTLMMKRRRRRRSKMKASLIGVGVEVLQTSRSSFTDKQIG